MKDSEIISLVQRHWELSRGFTSNLPLQRMLTGYRALKKSGRSNNDIVIYWSSPEVNMDRMDAGTFVAAMGQIEKYGTIQDPHEKPSWKEVFEESGLPGTQKFAFPWVKVTVIGAVALFVIWGLPNLYKAHRVSAKPKKNEDA